ncbi:hypothetical protein [Acidihalobacter yilgarnensis]|uniref:hypothetical protein n=1 Tax=Acidihalobacter yilgarnensis TaxID=2819280 RepID=UPI0012EAC27E|nr:hypothetical protein [Acidihalobacter yilgarnensis]
MTPLDIAGLIVGAGIIVVVKLMVTGVSMVATWVQRTEDMMRVKQEKIFAARK